MSSKTSSVNAEGIFEPFNVEEVPWEEYSHGGRFSVRSRSLGTFGGSQHVGVCMEELAPGMQAYPAHYHALEEEQLMVLDGRLSVRLGAKTYELGPGDYVCFPAGQKAGHALLNRGTQTCRYLIVGERNPHDVIVYTDSHKVKVRLSDEIYRKSATLAYWDGEEG